MSDGSSETEGDDEFTGSESGESQGSSKEEESSETNSDEPEINDVSREIVPEDTAEKKHPWEVYNESINLETKMSHMSISSSEEVETDQNQQKQRQEKFEIEKPIIFDYDNPPETFGG